MIVRGPNLTLRYAEPADAPRLFELGAAPEVTRFFSWGPYTEEVQALAYIESLAAKREAGELLEFVIDDAREGVVGVTGLTEFSPRDRRAIVGSWIGRPWWGTSVNAESKALVLGLGFGVLGLHRVSAVANPDNGRSLAALAKLGFVHEGVLVQWHRHGEAFRDCAMLRFCAADFAASPLGQVPFQVEGEPPPAFRVR